ncbi:ATP-binding dynein motor region/Dynein heavy chain region D6 P-loop domain/Dynein heavy chain AAA lid domain/Dynein heavy chain C-terminal domain containing protein, putative [Angomonas deanei]|uniref:ATP-binding dynein motor region/Dynein heavy chain region D6 P-loop domain/Dynein heavy chain AAA lid domain/Dynein heavy chain C-terminal domain containing protein, putative n=1 Tax=Angomonas deanei TaxID=59799 RepID=A0A7G2CGE9_9TRYP|nr:ATP-binding dynein motor region/Dynein heavy chain region D6 P-loop domain/Dynein heavy chain AAA lid domain/Dynein heavy chain C-terminal domain containing protein, putative [Angomonas deanei]
MDFLALPAQRLEWEEAGLPKDNLCVQNATVMQRCTRSTLLIDPSGTASSYLQNYYAKQKINKASFIRPGYLKQLENAVRFGYPIIIDDAEFLDPAIVPLLNQEFRRSGGRLITRIGAQDVDVSNTFKLFLYTRDPNYQPAPDIAGQVCLVNFTVTLSSLQSQCLHRVLMHERPEIDQKRTALMKVQGEYQLKLRMLEQNLLTLIAKSEGSLLDNNQLIDSLASIKKETKGIQEAISDSDASMHLIENTEMLYRPVATVTAKIFFALKRFSTLSTFYRYDVHFIFNIVEYSLSVLPESGKSDPNRETPSSEDISRLDLLARIIVSTVHKRAERGMFREDKLVLALRLAQLRSALLADMAATSDRRLEGLNDPNIVKEEEWEWLLDGLRVTSDGSASGKTAVEAEIPSVLLKDGLLTGGIQSKMALLKLLSKPAFKEIRDSLKSAANASKWAAVFTASDPLSEMETLPSNTFPANANPVRRMALFTFLLYYVRRDTFVSAANTLLRAFFDGYKDADVSLGSLPDADVQAAARFFSQRGDIADILLELNSGTPLLMVSDASHDPSTQIEQQAKRVNTPLRVVAMGSSEGTATVNRYLTDTLRDGGWLLLKNVHLDRTFMDRLEKQIHFERSEGKVNENFRLFLTADSSAAEAQHGGEENAYKVNSNSVVPINLIEESLVVVYEPPPGLKSLLQQTYGTMHAEEEEGHSMLQRVYLAVAWVHAVIMERLFYVPIGWSEVYEYSDIEFQRAIAAVHSWCVDATAKPPSISWLALQAIVAATVYGGRVDNVFDQHVLNILCRRLLTSKVFNSGFQFVETGPLITEKGPAPLESEHTTVKAIMKWIRGLPDGYSSPLWLGLPSTVARMKLSRNANLTVEHWSSIQLAVKEELLGSKGKGGKKGQAGVQVQELIDTRWSTTVKNYAAAWLEPLSRILSRLESNALVKKALSVQNASHKGEVLLGTNDLDEARALKEVVQPLDLAVQREVLVAVELFRLLVTDLGELQEVCNGVRSASEVHRQLMSDMVQDRVPPNWGKYISAHLAGTTGQSSVLISTWVADVQARGEHAVQLAEATEKHQLHSTGIALGLLFAPGSFLTASKQECGRKEKVALEQLVPSVELSSSDTIRSSGGTALFFTHVTMYSAKVNAKGQCTLIHANKSADSALTTITSSVTLKWTWVRKTATNVVATNLAAQNPSSNTIAIPFYVNDNRKVLLDVVSCPVDLSDATQLDDWYTRGVCLAAWSLPQ